VSSRSAKALETIRVFRISSIAPARLLPMPGDAGDRLAHAVDAFGVALDRGRAVCDSCVCGTVLRRRSPSGRRSRRGCAAISRFSMLRFSHVPPPQPVPPCPTSAKHFVSTSMYASQNRASVVWPLCLASRERRNGAVPAADPEQDQEVRHGLSARRAAEFVQHADEPLDFGDWCQEEPRRMALREPEPA